MKACPVIRWVLPLAGLFCGLIAGTALHPAPPERSAKTGNREPLSVVKTAPSLLSEVIYEDLSMEKRRTLAERVRIEQAILRLTPVEALHRALADSYRGMSLFDSPAHQLLWYRAASEDPARVWKEATERVHRNGGARRVSLPGLFLAWVEKDPVAALAAAQASGDSWGGFPSAADHCVTAWAARDAPACARALEGAELKNAAALFQSWTASDPAAALAWAQKHSPGAGVSTAYTQWSHADPLAASSGALPAALTAPPPPEGSGARSQASNCLSYAFYTFIERLPELALETACRDLPPLVRGQELDFVAQSLEKSLAGGGEKFALGLPPGKPRAWSVGRVAGEVAERGDIAHAMALVESLTPDETWPAIDSTLVYLARTDPETGRAWLLDMKPRLSAREDWFCAAQGFNSHLYQSRPSLAVDDGSAKE